LPCVGSYTPNQSGVQLNGHHPARGFLSDARRQMRVVQPSLFCRGAGNPGPRRGATPARATWLQIPSTATTSFGAWSNGSTRNCLQCETRQGVSDGQALYHFRGQMRCWPRLVDSGREGKLMGVADAAIGTPRRRVATLLRGLTFGSTTSRGPTSVSSAVLRRSRALASASTTPLSFEGL
jgi:hypothetical protein